MKVITVTSTAGFIYWINPAHIVRMARMTGKTTIVMIDGPIDVVELPEVIYGRIYE
jgi:uncharacterized protein YlzI (FlbEa/FlbD family)